MCITHRRLVQPGRVDGHRLHDLRPTRESPGRSGGPRVDELVAAPAQYTSTASTNSFCTCSADAQYTVHKSQHAARGTQQAAHSAR